MSIQPIYSEDQLLQELKLGNEQAFATIYERFAPLLIDYTAARLSSLEEARDLIHDLFVYVWEERDTISITHSLRAFLFAAVRYRIIDHIRRNMTRREYADKLIALQAEMTSSPETHIEVKDLEDSIQKAIDRLPPRVREVYRLSRQQHRSIAEIAAELDLSPQTVKNQLTTALSLLRTFLRHLPLVLIFLKKN